MTAQDRPRHLKSHTMVLLVGLELNKQPDYHGVLLRQYNTNKIEHTKCHTIPENMRLSAGGHDQTRGRLC